MATFITTIKFTQQGFKGIGETTHRATAFNATAKKMGVTVTGMYWTLGDHDGLIIYDAPDDETATAMLLQLGLLGNVHTSTVRAFNSAEMDSILKRTQPA